MGQGKFMAAGQPVEQGDEPADQIQGCLDDRSFSASGLGHGECGKNKSHRLRANSQGKKYKKG
jgi:hypothetical protein